MKKNLIKLLMIILVLLALNLIILLNVTPTKANDYTIFVKNNTIKKEYFEINDSINKRNITLRLNNLLKSSNILINNINLVEYYPTISPIKTTEFIEISAEFGWKNNPFNNKPIFHEGIDISAKYHTKIQSTMCGIVDKIIYSNYGYGNRIIIKNSQGFKILYAHLSFILVKTGQHVKKEQIIGSVGSTGLSTGNHLHYEIRKNNKISDPLTYFYIYLTSNLIAKNENTN